MKFFLALLLLFSSISYARNEIRIVGSSTIYPFITVVAERFGRHPEYRTPIVESTGSGGGIKLFCSKTDSPDMVSSSRKIRESEVKLCASNGTTEITEIIFGYDGIVIASSIDSPKYKFSKRDLFLALSKYVHKNGKLIENYYKKWSDINEDLPDYKIKIYGPSFVSGTRETFIELILQESCREYAIFSKVFPNIRERLTVCGQIREDGVYSEVGDNDNLIIHKLSVDSKSLGIIGYNFLEHSRSSVKAAEIDGFLPDEYVIASGQYPLSRPLYVYINDHHRKYVPSIDNFIAELKSKSAIGKHGYLKRKGLIARMRH